MSDDRAADSPADVSRRALLATGAAALAAGCQVGPLEGDDPGRTVAVDCDRSTGWRQYQTDAANSGVRAARPPSLDGDIERLAPVGERNGGVAVGDDGVYFGDQQSVRALDVAGRERWRREFRSLVYATPVLVCDAVVVQASTRTVALDRGDGTTLWEADAGAQFSEPLFDGERLFVAGGVTAAVDVADGTVRWSTDLDVDPWGCCLGDGTLVVAGPTDDGGALVGLDAASGERLWRTDLSRALKAAPTFRDGVAYVPDEGNGVHAVDAATGDLLWQRRPYDEIPGDRRASSPTATGESVVVPSGNGGTTVGVDPSTGERRWSVETGPTLAPPVATGAGVLVGTMNEGLFRVGPDGDVRGRRSDTRAGSQMALTDAGLFYKTAGLDPGLVRFTE
ncbi:PQQ-binding-like beta-propeller repeat protein [Halorarius halobius]|uniref:PQQ-binding-like beta-propeller repeat protein n=1 Tax=Halorarius halobius TaxID=2962671 RepID=UPI0020CF2F38|nr:PQQ-binding-like beta-propeller repeat protein [Halorarius halobius]